METSISPSQIQLSTRIPQSDCLFLRLPTDKLPDTLAQVGRSRTPRAGIGFSRSA